MVNKIDTDNPTEILKSDFHTNSNDIFDFSTLASDDLIAESNASEYENIFESEDHAVNDIVYEDEDENDIVYEDNVDNFEFIDLTNVKEALSKFTSEDKIENISSYIGDDFLYFDTLSSDEATTISGAVNANTANANNATTSIINSSNETNIVHFEFAVNFDGGIGSFDHTEYVTMGDVLNVGVSDLTESYDGSSDVSLSSADLSILNFDIF